MNKLVRVVRLVGVNTAGAEVYLFNMMPSRDFCSLLYFIQSHAFVLNEFG